VGHSTYHDTIVVKIGFVKGLQNEDRKKFCMETIEKAARILGAIKSTEISYSLNQISKQIRAKMHKFHRY
jgi:hypothetical protein